MTHPRTNPRPLFTTILLAACAGCLAAAPALGQALPEDRARVNHPDFSRYTGIANPSGKVTLAAPEDGVLDRITCEEGDPVHEDQVVASMDDRVQVELVGLAGLRAGDTSRIERAQADVRFYELDLKTVTKLMEQHAANEREVKLAKVRLDQARADLRGAQAEAEQAQSTLGVEQERLAELRLSAPFDGTVIERIAEPGATLRIGEPVLRIAAMDPLRVELPLPVELFNRLKPRATYRLVADSPVDTELDAVLLRIRPEVDSASETFVATFEVPNTDQRLPAGFRVHLANSTPIADARDEP